MTTTRSRRRTPLRRSHRAAVSPSPASMRILVPGVSTRNASPCPTSIAVTAKLRGGSTPVSSGAREIRVANTVASAARRASRPRPATIATDPAVTATTDAGRATSTTPPTSANAWATPSTRRAPGPASPNSTAPASGATSASAVPVNASTAATAAAGTASRFAGTEARDTSPKVANSTGTTAIWAPRVIEAISPARRGRRVGSWRRIIGARTRTPAVAVADSSRPSDPARRGSTARSRRTATARA